MMRCTVTEPPFEQLDFLYIPSVDVAADARYFSEVLGGHVIFAIDDGGTRAAMLEMSAGPPRLIFTDHLEGERAIMIYRVANLRTALKDLAARGWNPEGTFEIPQGPCCSFASPAGHRVALYEMTGRTSRRTSPGASTSSRRRRASRPSRAART
jgi:hypothetical protein